jgi:hypothetical protein
MWGFPAATAMTRLDPDCAIFRTSGYVLGWLASVPPILHRTKGTGMRARISKWPPGQIAVVLAVLVAVASLLVFRGLDERSDAAVSQSAAEAYARQARSLSGTDSAELHSNLTRLRAGGATIKVIQHFSDSVLAGSGKVDSVLLRQAIGYQRDVLYFGGLSLVEFAVAGVLLVAGSLMTWVWASSRRRARKERRG